MNDHYKRMRPLLGTYVAIGASRTSKGHELAVSAAFSKIEEVQKQLSFHDNSSDLSRINAARGLPIKVSPTSIIVLRLARRMTEISNGLFNCTLGGQMVNLDKLPNHDGLNPLSVGIAQDIEIRGRLVRLRRPVRITLDGIAKGYAVDLAVKVMKKMGVISGWVNAGGDLKVFGGIHLPIRRREIDGSFTNLGSFNNTAIATSAVSDDLDPNFPGVILSTSSNRPESGCWTVVARSAWLADALTKVTALATDEQRQALSARFNCRILPMPGIDKV